MTNQAGLFLVTYDIGTGMAGAPSFKVTMTVYTPEDTVSGGGNITQATNPPVNVNTQFSGQYTYMTVMPNQSKILVNATGYPVAHCPPQMGIGPVMMPNLQLQMVLSEDWQSGTANYKYCNDASGNWTEVKNAPVKAISANSLAKAA